MQLHLRDDNFIIISIRIATDLSTFLARIKDEHHHIFIVTLTVWREVHTPTCRTRRSTRCHQVPRRRSRPCSCRPSRILLEDSTGHESPIRIRPPRCASMDALRTQPSRLLLLPVPSIQEAVVDPARANRPRIRAPGPVMSRGMELGGASFLPPVSSELLPMASSSSIAVTARGRTGYLAVVGQLQGRVDLSPPTSASPRSGSRSSSPTSPTRSPGARISRGTHQSVSNRLQATR